jgi:CBS domain-containing protein
MNRMRASDVMSHPVVTIHPEAAIVDAIRLMHERRISGLPVGDKLGRLVGIVTEGDILLKEAGPGGVPLLAYLGAPFTHSPAPQALERVRGWTVGDVMTREVITAGQETAVREIACLMARHGINRIPIVRNEHVVGIVTRADVLSVFDRPDAALRAEVRRTLHDVLRIDPRSFEVEVAKGVVTLKGELKDERDIGLIETFLAEIDGVAGVDTSGLVPPRIPA